MTFVITKKRQAFRKDSRIIIEIFPMISSELKKVERVDVVFDTYRKDSIKSTARAKRGKRMRRRVEPTSQPPKNWGSLLSRLNENKTELFRYLSKTIIDAASGDMNVLCAYDYRVLSKQNHDMSMMYPCSQEEGDTRVEWNQKCEVAHCGYRCYRNWNKYV